MQRKSARPSRAPASLPDLYPLKVGQTEPAGRVFFRELPAGEAVHVLKAHRAAWAWCRRGMEPDAFGSAHPRALLRELAEQVVTRDLSLALVLLARLLARSSADPHRIAVACLAVGDCAVARGARQTALVWAETAAMAAPLNPRIAWVVGRLHRKWDCLPGAEYWLRRAVRSAIRIDDQYAQGLALTSLGNLHVQIGNYPVALELLDRALKRVRRYRLRSLEGPILHDQLLLAVVMGRHRDAEKFGALAFERYGLGHPNLPRLAYDLAYNWVEQGFFERALAVIESLLANHHESLTERMRALASVVRCTGAIGSRIAFDHYWDEAWSLVQDSACMSVRASTLVDMGKGALSMSEWNRATEALIWAVDSARDSGESDMLVVAEDALASVEGRKRIDRLPRHPRENAQAVKLAGELIKGLAGPDP